MNVMSTSDSHENKTVLVTVIGSDGRKVAVHVPANLVKFKQRENVSEESPKKKPLQIEETTYNEGGTNDGRVYTDDECIMLVNELHKRIDMYLSKDVKRYVLYREIGDVLGKEETSVNNKWKYMLKVYRKYIDRGTPRNKIPWPLYDKVAAFVKECEARTNEESETLPNVKNESQTELNEKVTGNIHWGQKETVKLLELYGSMVHRFYSGHWKKAALYREIAIKLNKPETPVESRIKHCLKIYRRYLTQREGFGDFDNIDWPYFQQIHSFMKRYEGTEEEKMGLDETTQDSTNASFPNEPDISCYEESFNEFEVDSIEQDMKPWTTVEILELIDAFLRRVEAFYSGGTKRYSIYQDIANKMNRKVRTISSQWNRMLWKYRFYLRRRDDYGNKVYWQPYFDKMHAFLRKYEPKEADRTGAYYEVVSQLPPEERGKVWPKEDLEKLIEAYKAIYDEFNCDSYNTHVDLWHKIAKGLEKPVKVVRAQWAILMRRYCEQLKRNNSKSPQNEDAEKFEHFDEMSLLLQDAVGLHRRCKNGEENGEVAESTSFSNASALPEGSILVKSDFNQGIHVITPLEATPTPANIRKMNKKQAAKRKANNTGLDLGCSNYGPQSQSKNMVSIVPKRLHDAGKIPSGGPPAKRKAIRELINSGGFGDRRGGDGGEAAALGTVMRELISVLREQNSIERRKNELIQDLIGRLDNALD